MAKNVRRVGAVRRKRGSARGAGARAERVRLGARFRALHLTAQARETLRTLEIDPDALTLVPPDSVAELRAAVTRIEAALRDPLVRRFEAGDPGIAGGEALERAKVWRRRFTLRARAALARGLAIPAGLGLMNALGGDPEELRRDLRRLIEEARPHLQLLQAVAIREETLQAGETLAAAIVRVDAKAEDERLAKLPAKVKSLVVEKGRAYRLLKRILALAQSVHAEITAGSAYNLDTLYRTSRRG